MKVISIDDRTRREWLASLDARREASESEAKAAAAAILDRVRQGGDAEVAKILRELDGVEIDPRELLAVPGSGSATAELAGAIDLACRRIEEVHRRQSERAAVVDTGGDLRQELLPMQRVGVYVPGGAAVYISTLMMCAIPARIAGVREIVVVTTPRVAAREEFSFVCARLGITEVYRCGGAAGIGALAFGTESLARVDKIVGPGNRFVAAAKELVRGRVGVDLPAGPSEIVVVADDSADPRCIAADLLAQAEHGADSLAICITVSPRLAARVDAEVATMLEDEGARGARAAIASSGAILVVRDLEVASSLADEIAPEHLSVQVETPDKVVDRIRNCAAIFVGRWSAVALGDYVAGSNHVLPTAGAARFCSALGVSDFLKRRTIVRLKESTFEAIAPAAVALAGFEGLPLHAASVEARRAAMTGVTR